MLVISAAPKNYFDYKSAVKKAKKYSADLIEVRIENIDPAVFKKILKDKTIEKIVTFRKEKVSGAALTRMRELYSIAFSSGAEYIDIDFSWGKEIIDDLISNSRKSKIILSYHDFQRTPRLAELKVILGRMEKIIAHSYKISVQANKMEDNARIFHLLESVQSKKIKLTAHCMGELGKVSRILGKKYGTYLTYSSIDDETTTAAGQLPVETIAEYLNYHKLNRKTKVYGIIGNPLKQSKSWIFHNYGFSMNNFNGVYVNFLTENVQSFAKTFAGLVDGVSITIPHKEKILSLSKQVSDLVGSIGSANTALFAHENIIFYNTDYLAAKKFICENSYLQNKNVLIIGAGGTARAFIFAMKEFNNNVYVTNRTIQKSKQLAQEFDVFLLENIKQKEVNFDVVVNATPGDNEYLLSTFKGVLKTGSVKLTMDVALNPFDSKFILLAERHNCKVINGFDFFLEQALIQFKLFTKSNLSRNQMRKYLLRNFNQSL